MQNKFDENNCAVISALLEIKDECYFFEKRILGEDFYNTNCNKFDFLYYRSIYSSFRDVCDLPLFFLINEEISNAGGRDALRSVISQALESKSAASSTEPSEPLNPPRSARHFQDLEYLFVYQYNEVLASLILDFTVSAFSTFEFWINRLYEHICVDYQVALIDRRIEKISKEFQKYAKSPDEEKLAKATQKMLSQPGRFVSFPDKLNGILKSIDQEIYPRNIAEDREIVDFISKLRNTVHNLGIHRGPSISIIVGGAQHILLENKPKQSGTWIDHLKLISQLVEIYTGLLSSLKDTDTFVPAFIIPQVDYRRIEILTLTMSDFIHIDLRNQDDLEKINSYSNFLHTRFNLTYMQSKEFIGNLLRLEKKNFTPLDTYALLAKITPA
ncbi:hypothetical protein [Herbaspirillum sp. SJZ107]|uniref:hypothetical protein n=1 Tax=Herbaspirillum sp. SJZ107 TaxID=2572881 RepID=UPI00114E00CE|nr:hypothetical protein [Herbaspirillum sp. SJZ107]TQK03495.1 hypothetical protein FBX97_5065 [Herbaspirillum sp. SJZ107]